MRFLNFLTLLLLSYSSTFAQKNLPSSITMETLNGEKVNLKKYVAEKGKVTVVNFWATWCKPCKEELDNINSDYLDEWKEKYDIVFIAVSMDDSRTKPKVKGVIATKGWEYDILCNPDNSAYQALGFNTCPYTLLLDANGNIVYKHTGYKHGDEEELEKEIAKAKLATSTKTNKTEVVDAEQEAAVKAREASKLALQKGITQDLEKILASKIIYYQNYINGSEKEEAFNKELNKLVEQIKATTQASGNHSEKTLDKPVDKALEPVREEKSIEKSSSDRPK